MKRRQGFTLTELLMAMMLLAIGMAVAFAIFDFGTYGFRVGMMRQGLQAEGRRIMTNLERDIRQSCLDGISTATGGSATEPRHAISVPGMNRWDFNGNFDDEGDPQYNRYIIYYATESNPGKLYRVEVEPAPAGSVNPAEPWDDFPSSFSGFPWNPGPPRYADIAAISPPLEVRMLAQHVSGFRVQMPGNGCVFCQVTLRDKARAAGQKQRDEIIQLNLYAPVYSTEIDPNT